MNAANPQAFPGGDGCGFIDYPALAEAEAP
jgi:hypothetical protein